MKKYNLLLALYFSLLLKNFSVSLENASQDRIYEAVNPRSSSIEIATLGPLMKCRNTSKNEIGPTVLR